MRKQRLASSLLFALLLLAPIKHLGGAQVPGEGDWWLKSAEDVRQTYVAAFILGFTKGYGSACLKATEDLPPSSGTGPENNPRHKCLQQGPHFPQSSDSISTLISEFYQRYPSDRDLYVEEIIASLGEGQTLEKIHETRPALPSKK